MNERTSRAGPEGFPEAVRPVAEGRAEGRSEPPDLRQGRPLWQGRFGEGPADELLEFCESLSFDSRLAADDLAGSRAHVDMLARVGLLTEDERAVVVAALARV